MLNKRTSIGSFLESTKVMLANAKEDEQISALLLTYKVDAQRYEAGLNLCQKGYLLEINQLKLHGQQYRAYKQFEKTYNSANDVYQMHLKFLRISFNKDMEKLKEISAKGIRPLNTADWLKQAFAFYQTAINDAEVTTEMDYYGITAEMLKAGEQKIYDVETAFRVHKNKMGAAQDAIDLRDQALKELAEFRRKFVAVCRIALKDHPQLLEKLGIKVYSEGYVKPKPADEEQVPPGGGDVLPQPSANASPAAITTITTPYTANVTSTAKKRKRRK